MGTSHESYLISSLILADIERRQGRPAAALQILGDVRETISKLVARDPLRTDNQLMLMRCNNLRGAALLATGNPQDALEAHRRALATVDPLLTSRQSDLQLRVYLADTYEYLGAAYIRLRDCDRAREWYQKSLDIWTNWQTWGISSAYDVRRRAEAARELARCK